VKPILDAPQPCSVPEIQHLGAGNLVNGIRIPAGILAQLWGYELDLTKSLPHSLCLFIESYISFAHSTMPAARPSHRDVYKGTFTIDVPVGWHAIVTAVRRSSLEFALLNLRDHFHADFTQAILASP
jgi:hypothetical protein